RYCRRSRQLGAENRDLRPHPTGRRSCLHKSAEAYRQAEDSPAATLAGVAGTATGCCAEEVPIGVLDQSRLELAAVRAVEAVQRRQRPTWGDFEDRPTAIRAGVVGPAKDCCSVEIPIGGLNQPRFGLAAVRAV